MIVILCMHPALIMYVICDQNHDNIFVFRVVIRYSTEGPEVVRVKNALVEP